MSNKKHTGLTRRAPSLMALEQRFMFDGAAIDSLHDTLTDTTPLDTAVVADVFKFDASTASLASTAQAAQQQVRDYLARATDAQLFSLFNGGKTAPDAEWSERLSSLREALSNGSFHVNVVAMDSASQFTAVAAFTENGPNGEPTIFINTYWFGMFDAPDATRALVEELGHAFDAYLNPNADSAGDEGEAFADTVIDGTLSAELGASLLTQSDQGTVTVNGVTYAVEFASLNFSNAYEMVYDWDTQDNSENTTERWASKEQNSHYFNTASLGVVNISDGSNGTNFSGNDISAVAVNVGGSTYYGWISRPIKSNGVVRGFYFWTDSSFTTLALAQADGNQDGDSSVADNRGFVLVVDQTWFNQQIADTDFTKTFTSTSKDVINGYVTSGATLTIANVGSSSDRVDSALNSVVSSNTAPSAVNDVASGTPSSTPSTGTGNAALEQGYNTNTSTIITATINGSGNVLANDTDSNSDSLSVTTVSSKLTGTSGTASSAGTQIIGKYGTLTMQSDGDWTYAVNNSSATINALLSGNIQEDFTYTASDGKGGTATATLTVQINGSNDAPVAANDYNTAKESLTSTDSQGVTTTTYAGYSANGTVFSNDSDVDNGDTKTITGSSTSGSATGTTQASSNQSSTVLSFTSVSSSIKVGAYVFWDGDQSLNNNNGSGTVNLQSGSTNITVQSIDYVNKTVTLSGVVSNKTLSGGTILGFGNNSNGNGYYKDAAIAGATSQTTSKIDLTSYSGTIAVGMTVSGGSLPAGTKVTNVEFDTNGNPTVVTISSTTTVTSASLTFAGSGTAGQTIGGKYGTLVLNSDGSYTYTPFSDNTAIDSGDVVLETFNYSMQDTAGVTSDATLYITVYGASTTSDPALSTDSATAYEAGVGRSSSSPYNVTNDGTAFSGVDISNSTTATGVLGNDSNVTGFTVNSYTKADGSSSTNAGSNLTGAYGTLNIASDGTYTYSVDNSNSTVNGLLPGATLTETFRYKITNSSSAFAWSTLTITIQGTNDAPTAIADPEATLTEDTITTTSGNVTTNDTDVDTGDTKTVTKAGTSSANTSVTSGSTSANGLTVDGTYGRLVIGADGTYTYVLGVTSAQNTAVQALNTASTPPTETFYYELTDNRGATSTTTLTFTVNGSNEPPVNKLNGTSFSGTSTTTLTTAINTDLTFTGSNALSVTDADTDLSSVTLTVEHGSLSFTGGTEAATTGSSITITGTQASINAALAYLKYTPTTNYTGSDYLTIASKDATNRWDTDGIAINIPTVFTGPTVLESDLSTGSNATGSGEVNNVTLTAPNGQTFGSSTQSGTDTYGTWTLTSGGVFTYTLTSAPAVSGANSTRSVSILTYDAFGNATTNTVTVTITDDAPAANANTKTVNEGSSASGNVLTDGTPDVFGADGAQTTSPTGGVIGVRAGSDTTTAATSGAGNTITGSYGSLVLNANGSYTYTATASISSTVTDVFVYTIEDADGDRSTTTLTITVNDASTPTIAVTGYGPVNEGSTYATFAVQPGNSSSSDLVDLSVSNGTTSLNAPAIEYSTDGTNWTLYDSSHKPNGGSVFYVRVNITSEADTPYEGSESFSLIAAYTANTSITDSASTSIVDDGTGTNYTGTITGGNPVTNTISLNDDRSLAVNSITVNEGGGYAVFTVSANAGQTMNLALSNGTVNPTATSGTDYTNSLEYWDGSAWVAYSAGFTVPGATNAAVSLYVRVAITNDSTFENAEDFKLTATYTSGASRSATGAATIVDDGTGTNYTGTITGGNPVTNTISLNDDRSLAVNSITVNEGNGSNYAVISVGTIAGQTLNLTLADGTAVRTGSGDTMDFGSTLQYWNGSAWTNYSAGFTVPGTANANTTVLVRVLLNADSTFENSENFTLTAAYANGGSKSATGTATIKDDGTGTKFTNGNPTGNDPTTITDNTNLDDDRSQPITVTGGNYNENSPRAVFTVNATQGQVLTLDVQDDAEPGKAPTGDNEGKPNDSLDNAAIYYSLDGGATWQRYTQPITAGSVPVLVAVDISNERDNVYEGEEQLKLVVTSGGQSASGYSSIFDDGTGTVTQDIRQNTRNDTGANDPSVTKDDDRPKAKPLPPVLPTTPPLSTRPEPTLDLPPVKPAPLAFNSELAPVAPALKPIDPPQPLGATLTSSSGRPFVANESAPPGLSLFSGVTDQFVQSTQAATTISIPYDAFVHSDKNAVIKLQAKQADDSPLPKWVEFDPAAGTFTVKPPKDFKGKLDLKVIARDDDGREATALFQMFVGEQDPVETKPQSRSSFTEKLRMAGKRPVTLVRVAEGPHKASGHESARVKVRAG
jgi:large repetitive protein